MGKKDIKIDAYIAKSADFAKPILKHIRELVHKACPEAEEVIKWGFPHFDYKGIMFSMAAFKQHCAAGFWKAKIMKDPGKILTTDEKTAMGSLGQIKSLKDLPPDKIFIQYIKEAAKLNEDGIALPPKRINTDRKELVVPDYFTKAINKNKKAKKAFENFSYSKRKEYVDWLTEAKSEDTRNKRMETAIAWISYGKSRNWKYERK
jgi:uncharacterized protein YdeI (YjbR/CyaY-like superfamily)